MDFQNLKEVITFAIEREIEAADFYEENSKAESMSGKKEMLLEFAAEERKHQRLLESYLNQCVADGQEGFTEDACIIDGLENYKFKWITDIKRSNYIAELEYKPGMAYNELLMLAMKREEHALALYNKLLDEADTDSAKTLFKMLCQEEAKHKLALETMYDDFMAEMGD
ncbi:MAG: ferritin family protein [Desulfosarcinaceae bacterium]|nr:ferritin family protein [Desulfosarcinaceae bacterium]